MYVFKLKYMIEAVLPSASKICIRFLPCPFKSENVGEYAIFQTHSINVACIVSWEMGSIDGRTVMYYYSFYQNVLD